MEPIIIINDESYSFTKYQLQFFKRIKREPKVIKTIDDIRFIMIACSEVFSFENLDIISNTYKDLNREVLIEQVLENQEGGLCYKANTLLNYFLKEFGFNIYLSRGTVENQEHHKRFNINSGHMFNILNFESKLYLMDVAFGCNLAMSPIPISNCENEEEIEIVSSIVGDYRVRKHFNKIIGIMGELNYTHILEYKRSKEYNIESLRNWTMGYAFDPLLNLSTPEEENKIPSHQTQIQQLVIDDIHKDFCLRPIVSKIIKNESFTLTLNSLTITNCYTGEKNKINFDNQSQFEQFNHYLESIYKLPKLKNKPLIFN